MLTGCVVTTALVRRSASSAKYSISNRNSRFSKHHWHVP